MLTRRAYLLLLLGLVLPLFVLGFGLVFTGSQRSGFLLAAAGFVIQGALLLAQTGASRR